MLVYIRLTAKKGVTAMKRLILSILILSFAVTVHADPIGTITRDAIRFYEESILIRDADGKEVDTIRPYYLRPGEYRLLDRMGEQTGRIKKDLIREGQYIIDKVNDR
jgi:hypothetical protein